MSYFLIPDRHKCSFSAQLKQYVMCVWTELRSDFGKKKKSPYPGLWIIENSDHRRRREWPGCCNLHPLFISDFKHPQPGAFSWPAQPCLASSHPHHTNTHTELPFIPVHPSLCLHDPKLFCTPVALWLCGLLPRQQSDGFVFIRPCDLPSGQALALPRLWMTFSPQPPAPHPHPDSHSARTVDDL